MSKKEDLAACVIALCSDEILVALEHRKAQILASSTPVTFGTRYGMRQDYQPLTKHVLAGIDRQIKARTKQIADAHNVGLKKAEQMKKQ